MCVQLTMFSPQPTRGLHFPTCPNFLPHLPRQRSNPICACHWAVVAEFVEGMALMLGIQVTSGDLQQMFEAIERH